MDSHISNPAAPLGRLPGGQPAGDAFVGRIRATTPRTGEKIDPIRQFTAVAQVIRESGLLRRAPWFYGLLLGGLGLLLVAAVVASVLLGDSWLQLLIAAALGILFTQFAFFSHEAAHRQVFASGPANDRAGRLVGTLLVGMSYSWWMNKHTRHHANPNQIGKDPDIAGDIIAFTEEKAIGARGPLAISLMSLAIL
jgi:fatty acid desaturase